MLGRATRQVVNSDVALPGEGSYRGVGTRPPVLPAAVQPQGPTGSIRAPGAYARTRLALKLAAVVGSRTAAAGRFGPLAAAALVAMMAAVVTYPSHRDAGFAILVVGGAAGWLFALLTALIGLPHIAAEKEGVAERNAAGERRLEGLTLLLKTAESLAAAADRDTVLNTAVHASARGISRAGAGRVPHAAFHSVVGEQVNISVVADEDVERDIAVGFEYPIARNQAARGATRIGRPAFVRPDHMTGALRELADRLGWQVLIMAPVYCGGSLQGFLAATGRDGPSVDPFEQYMLAALARLTSLSLESTARIDEQLRMAAENATRETQIPMLLPGIVNELRNAVQPIKSQILDLRASKNRPSLAGDDVFGKLDDLISALASRTAIDSTTGVLSRELGLAALERDVLRARRSQAPSHCVAVLRVATAEAGNGTELVRLVADRLRSGLRREDLIFRNAEDEFVCSFADMNNADAGRILNRIQSELARELGYTPFTIGLTSVGLEQTAG